MQSRAFQNLYALRQAGRRALDTAASFVSGRCLFADRGQRVPPVRLLVDVLGLSPDLCATGGAMERPRAKLAAEPQIHSDICTHVVFTDDGGTMESR